MSEPETVEQQVEKVDKRRSRKGIPTGVFHGNKRTSVVPLDERQIEQFNHEKPEKQTRILKERWMRIANLAGMRAEEFAKKVDKKDFGRFVQVLMAMGIAYDKVVPKHENIQPQNLIVQLFGSLPHEELKQVSTPVTPVIDMIKETPKDGSETPTFQCASDLRRPDPGGESPGR